MCADKDDRGSKNNDDGGPELESDDRRVVSDREAERMPREAEADGTLPRDSNNSHPKSGTTPTSSSPQVVSLKNKTSDTTAAADGGLGGKGARKRQGPEGPAAKEGGSPELIVGDLLDIPDRFEDCLICHQCNTMTTGPKGIAKAIFVKYPHADVYARRNWRVKKAGWDPLGTIAVRAPVCNLFSQHKPGKPDPPRETHEMRYRWLKECLNLIETDTSQKVIAFPYLIGCGLAGGSWPRVLSLLKDFAARIGLQGRKVLIVKLQDLPQPEKPITKKAKQEIKPKATKVSSSSAFAVGPAAGPSPSRAPEDRKAAAATIAHFFRKAAQKKNKE